MPFRLGCALVVSCALVACERNSAGPSLRVDLSQLQRGLEGVAVGSVTFEGTCNDDSGVVLFTRGDGEATAKLTLDARDDDTYSMGVAASCADVTLVATVYRQATASEGVDVTAAVGSALVTLAPGEQEVVFGVFRAGEVLLGYTSKTAAGPCELELTRVGGDEEPRALGTLNADEALGVSLRVGSYIVDCVGADVQLGPQAFSVSFAERTLLELVTPTKSSLPAALVFVVAPTSPVLSAAMWTPFVVGLVDANGQRVPADGVTVSLSGTGLSGTLSVTTVQGLATFNDVRALTAGTIAIDLSSPGLTGILGTEITVTSRPAARLAFVTPPQNGSVDTQQALAVKVLDDNGNVSLDPTTVTLAIGPGAPTNGTCFGCASAMAVAGVATFDSVQVTVPGTYTFVASAPSLPDETGSASFLHGAVAKLHINTTPTQAMTVDDAIAPAITVSALDQFNNVVTTPASLELVTSAQPAGGGFANGVALTDGSGVATFTGARPTIAAPGQAVRARVVATPVVLTDNSVTLDVTHGVAADLRFVGVPATLTAGPHPIAVQVVDQGGNRVMTASGALSGLSSGNGGDFVPGELTISTGEALVSIDFGPVGPRTMTASLGAFTDTATTTIVPGPAVAFALGGISGTVNADDMLNLVVTAVDLRSNVALGYTGTATLTVPTQVGFTPLNYTFDGTESATHTFPMRLLDASVQHTILVDAGPVSGTLSGIIVSPGALADVVFSLEPPLTVTQFTPFTARVTAIDAHNNTITTDNTSNVTLTLLGGPGPLGGIGSTQLVSGERVFSSLTIGQPGAGYQLQASVGAFTKLSRSFDVTPNLTPQVERVCSPVIVPGVRVAVKGALFGALASDNTLDVAGVAGPTALDDYTPIAFSFVAPTGLPGAPGTFTVTTSQGTSTPLNVLPGPIPANTPLGSGLYAKLASVSADGRYVAFVSNDNLDSAPELIFQGEDVFLFDRENPAGIPERISVGPAGELGDHGETYFSTSPSISGDGCRIAFLAESETFGAPASTQVELYLRDRCAIPPTTTRVTRTTDGGPVGAGAENPRISADGNVIVFDSTATNLVPGDTAVRDVFAYDVRTGVIEKVSEYFTGAALASVSANNRDATVSADGRFVAFVSDTEGVPGGCGGVSANVLWVDRYTREFRCVGRDDAGTVADDVTDSPSIDGRGERVAFRSLATNLINGDPEPSGQSDVFVRDVFTNLVVRISATGPTGTVSGSSLEPRISLDGEYVAFQSTAEALAGGGNFPGTNHVIVRRVSTNELNVVDRKIDGSVLSGAGTDVLDMELSADGTTIAFATPAQLTASVDSEVDVFVTNTGRHDCPPPFLYSTDVLDLARPGTRMEVRGYGFEPAFASNQCDFDGPPNATVLGGSDGALVLQVPSPFNGGSLVCRAYGQPSLTSPRSPTFKHAPDVASRSGNTVGNQVSATPRLSADGRFVVYESMSTNFPQDGEATAADIFVRSRDGGGVVSAVLVSARTPTGPTGPLAFAENADISYSGRFVAFDSPSTDLTPAPDTNAARDVFWSDRLAKTMLMVSVSPTGSVGNGTSASPRVSGDGRYVVFVSDATNLEADAVTIPVSSKQVYIRDMFDDTTRLVSRVGASGVSGTCSEPQIDALGRTVAFVSDAPNLPAANGKKQVYLTALPDDFITNPTGLVHDVVSATSGDAAVSNEDTFGLSLSGNGRVVAFASAATNLDTPTPAGVYIFRSEVGFDPVRITGVGDAGSGAATAIDYAGTRIVFTSLADERNDGSDTNGVSDVYAWSGGPLCRVSVAANGAQLTTGAFEPAISAFGGIVAFTTNDNLAQAPVIDANGGGDVYVGAVCE